MRLVRLALAAALGTALLAACGGDGGTNVAANLTGRWVGANARTTIGVTLAQDRTSVTGTGTLSDENGVASISVFGTYTPPSFTLTINFPNTPFNPITFSGTVPRSTVMNGTLTGSGYLGEPIQLVRQETAR